MEKYDKYRLIGEGSFGQVYKGRVKKTGKLVAMKLISKANRPEKEVESLRKECKIQRKLQKHPNIIHMVDAFETPESLVVVTEYANGDLFSLLRREKRLPVEKVRLIAGNLVSALSYLHKQRILHRDIKLQNILIGFDGMAKLCDFGFARTMDIDTYLLTSFKGTPLYMAPEMVNGVPYDQNADLWSLGCILYELLVSVPPVLATTISELYTKIREDILWPDEVFGKIDECRTFLQGLLQKDPSKRLTWPALREHKFVVQYVFDDKPEDNFSLTKALSPSQEIAKEKQREHLQWKLHGYSKIMARTAKKMEVAQKELKDCSNDPSNPRITPFRQTPLSSPNGGGGQASSSKSKPKTTSSNKNTNGSNNNHHNNNRGTNLNDYREDSDTNSQSSCETMTSTSSSISDISDEDEDDDGRTVIHEFSSPSPRVLFSPDENECNHQHPHHHPHHQHHNNSHHKENAHHSNNNNSHHSQFSSSSHSHSSTKYNNINTSSSNNMNNTIVVQNTNKMKNGLELSPSSPTNNYHHHHNNNLETIQSGIANLPFPDRTSEDHDHENNDREIEEIEQMRDDRLGKYSDGSNNNNKHQSQSQTQTQSREEDRKGRGSSSSNLLKGKSNNSSTNKNNNVNNNNNNNSSSSQKGRSDLWKSGDLLALHSFGSEDKPIECEEWVAFVQKMMMNEVYLTPECLCEKHFLTVLVAPLRNHLASAIVIERIATLLAEPFTLMEHHQRNPDLKRNLELSYLDTKVLPNLLYSCKLILRRRRIARLSLNLNSKDAHTNNMVDILEDEDLDGMDRCMRLISYLVHAQPGFAVQLCDSICILQAFPFFILFLKLDKKRVRLTIDTLSVLCHVLRQLPGNHKIIEELLLEYHNPEEEESEIFRLLTHSEPTVQAKTFRLIAYLLIYSEKSRQQLIQPKAKDLWKILRKTINQSNQNPIVLNAANFTLDKLKQVFPDSSQSSEKEDLDLDEVTVSQ